MQTIELVSVGSAIASSTAGKRATETAGQAQMRIGSTIEVVLLGEIAVEIACFLFSNVCG